MSLLFNSVLQSVSSDAVLAVKDKRYRMQDILFRAQELAGSYRQFKSRLVALDGDSSYEFLLQLLALTAAQAVVCPVPLRNVTEERKKIIETIKPVAHISLEGQLSKLAGNEFALEEGGFVRFTSGTVAKEKGVVISQKRAAFRAESAASSMKFAKNDSILWTLPVEYHFVTALFAALMAGSSIYFGSNLTEEISVIYSAPSELSLMASSLDKKPEGLRLAVSTTAQTSIEDAKRFEDRAEVVISRVYGAIEVGLAVGNINRQSGFDDSSGFAFKGYKAEIDNEGFLKFYSEGICDGYLSPCIERASILDSGGYYRTADLAEKLSDDSIRILGRADTVINVAGFKIFPEEVEEVLLRHPEIEKAFVYAAQSGITGNVVAADLVCGKEMEESEVRKHCRKFLQSVKIPQQIRFVDEVVQTSSGKVRRWKR